jgi:hypothetical protein
MNPVLAFIWDPATPPTLYPPAPHSSPQRPLHLRTEAEITDQDTFHTTFAATLKVWQGIPREQRRRHIIWQIVGFSVAAPLLAVLIIAPWGAQNTMLVVIGGLCLIIIVAVAIVATQGFIRSRRTS